MTALGEQDCHLHFNCYFIMAGKTYTMEGPGGKRSNDDGDEQKGIIPRAMDLIFSRTHDLGKHGWTVRFMFN